MPFNIKMPGLGQGSKDESSNSHATLEKAVAERGSAVLETKYQGIPAESEPCSYVAEVGRAPEMYRAVEKHITTNYPLEEVHWPDTESGAEAGDIWVFAPQEGRKYLQGGEAKVAVVDTKDARIIAVCRPSDEHMPQDGLGFTVCEDFSGATRIGIAVLDGKTKVDVGDPSYIPYSSGKSYYSKADQFARFGSGYLPRRLALGFGNTRHEVTQAMGVIDRYKRGEFVPYGFEGEKVPYGTSTAQLTAIKLAGNSAMEVQVLNLGKAGSGLASDEGDLGGHVLMVDEFGISRLGNDLELGTYGTKRGYVETGLIYATSHKSGGVTSVQEQIYYSFTDGFRAVRQPVKLGKTSITVERLATLSPAEIVDALESGASAVFGNPQASHDDGTLVMVVPNSVRAGGGFNYEAFYKPLAPVSRPVEIRTAPVGELPLEVTERVIGASQVTQLVTPILGEVVFEGAETGGVVAAGESVGVIVQAEGPQPEEINAPQEVEQPDPRLMLIDDVRSMLAKGLAGEQRVTLADVAKLMGVETPSERPVRQELVQAVTLLAQRLGVAIESQILTGEIDEALIQIARHLEAKMAELKTKVEAGWTKGTVDLDAVAKLFELDIDPQAKQVAIDRAKAKAEATARQTPPPAKPKRK